MAVKKAIFWGIKPRSYLTRNTLCPCYIVQPVNVM
jgi:hypothetical protein